MKNIFYKGYFDFYDKVIVPSKSLIPDWYKNTKNDFLSDGKNNPLNFLDNKKKNFKLCMPFFDSFTTGYLVLCPGDLIVSRDEEGNPSINWPDPENRFADLRENPSATIPVPHGCSPENFTWTFPAAIKFPKEYSAIFTHPFNRFDLPFVTTSGIVDGNFAFGHGNYPFFIKDNFQGVIKQGTPIAQIIPFKRESWSLKEDKELTQEAEINHKKSNSVIFGWYKNYHWKKKEYN
jgi:hypothetical protein